MSTTYSPTTMIAQPTSLKQLIFNYKTNFLRRSIKITDNLTFNQYEIIKRAYFYSHNQFMSGPLDENGQPKYFYDLCTDRNDQATKNIDLDTKDCYIKAEGGGAYLKSWMLRREFMGYAKTSGFGMKLNELSSDLPAFGTVVWKKVKDKDGKVDVHQVELINIINDPTAKKLSKGLFVERHMMSQDDLHKKEDTWGKAKVSDLIKKGRTVRRTQFMTDFGPNVTDTQVTADDTTPYYEVFELWGEVPYALYKRYETGKEDSPVKISDKPYLAGYYEPVSSPEKPEAASDVLSDEDKNRTVYVMAIVAGIDDGCEEQVIFCKEQQREDFPYKEVHYRRRKGRWLGLGNYELLFDLIEKANEITNRYYSSLRLALLHIYQTRDKNHVRNVLTDLLDGDVIVTRSELTALPTEIRGAAEFKAELDRIERRADALCNAYEVISGADLPSGTPYKLGQQQLTSATKLFKFIQQNIGLFIEQVFNEWLLPDFAKGLTPEHILDLIDNADDLEVYYNAKKRLMQYEMLKKYVLETNEMPDPGQLELVGSIVKDQIAKSPKQILVEANYYADQKYSLKTVVTGENDAKKEGNETMANLTQTIAGNPQALQDPRFMKLLNMIMENNGFSPLEINSINNTPTNPSLNPANQGGGGVERSMVDGGGAGGMPMSMPTAAAMAT